MRRYFVQWMACVVCLAAVESEAATGRLWKAGATEYRRTAAGKWGEFNNGTLVHEFVETAHTPESVLLYDASRGFNVRLHGDKAVVTSGTTTLRSDPGRWLWQGWKSADGKGHLTHLGNGKWQEYINGAPTHSFRETFRGATEIHLFDMTRGITVKLSADKNVVTSGNDTLATVPGTWSD